MIVRLSLLAIPLLVSASTPNTAVIQTVAGTSFAGDGGTATAAILSQPQGLAMDASGDLYIADADDNRVRKVLSNGTIQTFAGTGFAGFSGDGGPAVQAQLSHPYGVALDSAGNVYIADLGNARVRRVGLDGNISTVLGGGSSAGNVSPDGTQATAIKLNAPRNLAVDRAGTLYVADFGANQIYRVSSTGLFYTYAGTGTAGSSGDNATARLAQLSAPAGLAIDTSGNLFLADNGNNRVRKISQGVISTIFSVQGPTGVAVNAAGTLYVAAPTYFGTILKTVGSGIVARDVTTDLAGNLYLSTNNFVSKLSITNLMTIAAGSGASRYYGGDGGPAINARLHNPAAVAIDDLGNAYIADTGNNRIRKVDASGLITTYAGTGDAGSSLGNGSAMLAQFNGPVGVALDSQRNLYVADTGNNRVCLISPSGAITVVIDKLSGPSAVAVDGKGMLYVADTGNNRVLAVTPAGVSSTVTTLLSPVAIVVDLNGNLFVSEGVRVSEIPEQGVLTTLVDGLKNARGLAVTATGSVIVSDAASEMIEMIDTEGNVTPLAGTGVPGFAGDGSPAISAQVDSPTGLAVDAAGNIWIADTANQRVRRIVAPALSNLSVALPQPTVVNAASQAVTPIAPGEIVTIYGSGFDPKATLVSFDGVPTTALYSGTNQLNVLVPSTLQAGRSTNLVIAVHGTASAAISLSVAATAPGLFGAVLNEDGSVNSPQNPAMRGTIVSLFGTGWSTNAATVTIGGYASEVLYSGSAPGFPGLAQVNVRVPSGFLPPGNQAVLVSIGGAQSQPGITIAVQ